MGLFDRVQGLWSAARSAQARLPLRVQLPPERLDETSREGLGDSFVRDGCYFQVELNEVFLANSRQWLTTVEPMVLVVSEFIYGTEQAGVPFVVGRGLLDEHGSQGLPQGMLYTDTRVAGIHPYRGGRLTLTVVLYQVPRDNLARDVLEIVESAAAVFDFATTLTPYSRLAGVLLDGVERITGTDGTRPVIGQRRELDLDADGIPPGFFALIDLPEDQDDRYTFWVVGNQLRCGPSAQQAEPFRDADYILYSLVSRPTRDDERLLDFYPLWQRVLREASAGTPNAWTSAKANMASLHQSLAVSPDLTPPHAHELADRFVAEMKDMHDRSLAIADLGPGDEPDAQAVPADARRASLQILEL